MYGFHRRMLAILVEDLEMVAADLQGKFVVLGTLGIVGVLAAAQLHLVAPEQAAELDALAAA